MKPKQPLYQQEWVMWTAVAALILSVIASWYGWKVSHSELSVGTLLRVYAGLVAIGRTIAKKETEGKA